MPQNPTGAYVAKTPANVLAPLSIDAAGNLKVSAQEVSSDAKSSLNITANTVVKASAGKILQISVVVAGSAAGSVYDAATVATAAAANEIAVLPGTAGVLAIKDWPCATGIVVEPGTGQTIAVAYV